MKPRRRLGAERSEERHEVGVCRERRELRLLRVEEPLVVRHAVSHGVDGEEPALQVGAVVAPGPRVVQDGDPKVALAAPVGHVRPEAERERRDDLARAFGAPSEAGGRIDGLPVHEVHVAHLARPALAQDGPAHGRARVEEPVRCPVPVLGEHAVVGVAQRHLEVSHVAHEDLGEGDVPLVELDGVARVASARLKVGHEALLGKPEPRPLAGAGRGLFCHGDPKLVKI